MSLTLEEEKKLQQLQEEEQHFQLLFHINTLIHVIGSFIGWISIAIFLFATGLPPLFFAFFGLIQMAILLFIQSKNFLSSSLLLILMILGHLAFFIGIYEAFKLSLAYLLLIEILITVLALRYYRSKVYHFLQIGFVFTLIFMLPHGYQFTPIAVILLWSASLLVLLYLWVRPRELLSSSRLALMLVQSFYLLPLFISHDSLRHLESDAQLHSHLLQYLSSLTTLCLAGFLFYAFKNLRKNLLAVAITIALLILSWFAPQALSLPLLFLALSFYSHEAFMRYIALLTFALFLFYYYYMLLMPLDQKSLLLMLTGAICLLIYYLLKKQMSPS